MTQTERELLEALKASSNYVDTLGGNSIRYRQVIAKAEAERVEPVKIDYTVLHEFAEGNAISYNKLCTAVNMAITTAPTASVSEPDLSSLSDAGKERVRKWIADGTFVERAIGTMLDQERALMKYEKATPPAAVSEPLTDEQISYYAEQEMDLYSFARAIEAAIRSK
jgi:hypothetical protein